MSHTTDAAEILAAGAAIPDAQIDTAGNAVVIPDGYRIEDLEIFHANPRRIRAAIAARTLESFLAYYERFHNDASVVFVDREAAKVEAVLDYHAEGAPAWGSHRIKYQMPYTPEWRAWKAGDGKKMNQVEFSEFIEERIADFDEPEGAAMLEVAKNLKAQKKVEFASAVNIANGDVQFTYETETHAKGHVDVPETFSIGVKLFEDGNGYRVEARLRYRISDDGKLTMWYTLIRPDKALEAAVNDVVDVLKERTAADRLFMATVS